MNEIELDGKSKNIVSDNISKLKEIFPDAVIDNKIDFDQLRVDLGDNIDDSSEKYIFNWPGKIKSNREAQKQSNGTLRPCREDSEEWESTKNLYIEGDNLEVLKLLQKGYYNKVKCIYIDPPYNTGKDFIYPDNYQDNLANYLKISGQVTESDDSTTSKKLTTNLETSGKFHTKWLNFIYPRLKLARNLLRDDGAIFISIDDNEVENLKKMCDEIFGADNFLAQITVIVKPEGRRYGFFAKTQEYILVYAKNNDFLNLNEIEVEGKSFSYSDEKGGFNLKELRNGNTKAFNSSNRPNLRYPFYVDLSSKDENGFYKVDVNYNENYEEVWPITVNEIESVWRWGKEKAINENDDLTAKMGNDGIFRVFQKTRKLTQTAKTLWQSKDFISNKGSKEILELFDEKVFDFPKPVNLIKRVLEIGTDNDSIVLDCFSGSGTTAHSLFKNNVDFDKNCKFIMVQFPIETEEDSYAFKAGYKNICEIGKERIRRAGNKIAKESGNDNLDIGFKVFKLDSSNLKKWDPDYKDIQKSLTPDQIKEDRTNEDLVYELMLKYGIELTLPIKKQGNIYSIGYGALVICLDDNITKEIANEILDILDDSSFTRVVFKDSGFASDEDKTNIKQILKDNHVNEFITL